MTHETLHDWLQRCLITCFIIMALTGAAIALGVTVGYAEGTKEQREARCINSLCEYPCKEGAKFVKNQGCKP